MVTFLLIFPVASEVQVIPSNWVRFAKETTRIIDAGKRKRKEEEVQ